MLGDQTHFQSKDERSKLASELSHKSTSELFDMLESSSPAVSSTRTLVSRLLLERTGRYSVELSPQEVQVSSLSLRELFQLVSDRGGALALGYSEMDLHRAGQIIDDTLLRLAVSE